MDDDPKQTGGTTTRVLIRSVLWIVSITCLALLILASPLLIQAFREKRARDRAVNNMGQLQEALRAYHERHPSDVPFLKDLYEREIQSATDEDLRDPDGQLIRRHLQRNQKQLEGRLESPD
jgi:hypothetical protein